MKILLCTPYSISPQMTQGGITVWAHNIMDYYHTLDKDVQVDVVSFDRKRIKGGMLKRVIGGLNDYRKPIKEIGKRLEGRQYDVLHLCTSASLSLIKDIVVLRKAKQKGLKTIIHLHFGRVPEMAQRNNWEWKMLQRVFHLSDNIVTIDQKSYITLQEKGYKNTRYLPNPLSNKIILQIKESELVKRDEQKICFVGHVIPSKGVYELAEAFKGFYDIKLYVIGKVSDEVKARMLELAGGNDSIKFIGEVPHEEVIYQLLTSNIFVLPSYTEGFPNVILESMACGCAIVATSVGAIPEMLNIDTSEPCGLCCNPKDVDGLRRNIQFYLDNPTERKTIIDRATMRVNKMYAIPIVWKQLVGIWKE